MKQKVQKKWRPLILVQSSSKVYVYITVDTIKVDKYNVKMAKYWNKWFCECVALKFLCAEKKLKVLILSSVSDNNFIDGLWKENNRQCMKEKTVKTHLICQCFLSLCYSNLISKIMDDFLMNTTRPPMQAQGHPCLFFNDRR